MIPGPVSRSISKPSYSWQRREKEGRNWRNMHGSAKAQLLKAFNVGPDDLSGAGQEAHVYALGTDRVLRIFQDRVPLDRLRRRLSFYDAIRSHEAPFRTPSILDVGESHGRVYWIEPRLPGISLASRLPILAGRARSRALASYVDAAAASSDRKSVV